MAAPLRDTRFLAKSHTSRSQQQRHAEQAAATPREHWAAARVPADPLQLSNRGGPVLPGGIAPRHSAPGTGYQR